MSLLSQVEEDSFSEEEFEEVKIKPEITPDVVERIAYKINKQLTNLPLYFSSEDLYDFLTNLN